MTQLYVDLDALSELARQLGQIKTSLESAKDRVNAHDRRVGTPKIEGSLDRYIGGWRDGRKKIIGGVEGASGRIQAAADIYLEQEARLSGAEG